VIGRRVLIKVLEFFLNLRTVRFIHLPLSFMIVWDWL
jgi:hypothetical protein